MKQHKKKIFDFTGSKQTLKNGVVVWRIISTRTLPQYGVYKNSLGGWIERTDNLSENAWISSEACVFGNAKVYGNSYIDCEAWIYGNAHVFENAKIYGNAHVFENAKIYGNAQVYGYSKISGNAEIYKNAEIFDADVCGISKIKSAKYLNCEQKMW